MMVNIDLVSMVASTWVNNDGFAAPGTRANGGWGLAWMNVTQKKLADIYNYYYVQ